MTITSVISDMENITAYCVVRISTTPMPMFCFADSL